MSKSVTRRLGRGVRARVWLGRSTEGLHAAVGAPALLAAATTDTRQPPTTPPSTCRNRQRVHPEM